MKPNMQLLQKAFILFISLSFFGCTKQSKNAPIEPSAHDIQAKAEAEAFFDIKPDQKAISYLYVPGFTATEKVMGRYCPRFTACTGEKITWRSGGHTIGQPHSSVNFPEIDLHKPTCFTLNPVKAYINAVRRDLFPVALRFLQEMYDFDVEDNPASSKSVVNYSIKFGSANIGQLKDSIAMRKAYNRHLTKYPEHDVILYGDSRGAVTIFNFIATHNPPNVKAAVLEGIFDNMNHLVKHFMFVDKGDRAEERLHSTISMVMGSYNKKGPFPRDMAETIGDDIPLLFVTSLKDGLCCPQGAMFLYNRLKERGHKKVHIVVLEHCYHPAYMISDKNDKQLYETTVHAFYKHYGLPHNAAKAAQGAASFAKTQPAAGTLKDAYDLPKCEYC